MIVPVRRYNFAKQSMRRFDIVLLALAYIVSQDYSTTHKYSDFILPEKSKITYCTSQHNDTKRYAIVSFHLKSLKSLVT